MVITPEVWGPYGWKFMHFVALAYPQKPTADDKKNYKTFFESIQNILPCALCSNNYKKHLLELPLTDTVLESNVNLVRWSIDRHNKDNVLNKKEPMGYEKAINLLINNYKENKEPELPQSTMKDYKEPKKDEDSIFLNFSFWCFVFMVLVTIAIIYKKS